MRGRIAMKKILAVVLLVAALSPAIGSAEETRTINYRDRRPPTGVENCPSRVTSYKSGSITFPVLGGEISGSAKVVYASLIPEYEETPAYCNITSDRGTVSGTFEGGDWGKAKVKVNWTGENAGSDRLNGRFSADGKSFLAESDNPAMRYPLRHAPFDDCITDTYRYKKREVLEEYLIKLAARRIAKELADTIAAITKKTGAKVRKAGVSEWTFQSILDKGVLIAGFMDQEKASVRAAKVLAWAEMVGNTLTYLEAAEAASAGDFKKIAMMSVLNYAASSSNAASMLIVLGQAAKADWDRFSKEVHDKFYRHFYERIYFTGVRPKVDKPVSRRARLREFMTVAKLHLEGDSFQRSQFKNLLVNFARRSLGNNDVVGSHFFIPNSGKMKQEAAAVLIALFHSYERTYINDRKAEQTRRAAVEQSRGMKKAAEDAAKRIEKAENGDFAQAWPNKRDYKKTFCRVVGQLRRKGKL